MKSKFGDAEQILSRSISGFHQYILSGSPRLIYASDNLCQMMGFSGKELLSRTSDRYLTMVHPGDRDMYSAFLYEMGKKEQTLSVEYRLIKKDGSVLYVKDTMTSAAGPDGVMAGYSVLSDITKIKSESDNLRFLNDTIPCGFIRYTCDKRPKVTYINENMLEFLRIPKASAGEADYLEMYRDNIFMMIPMEERSRFSLYLSRVRSAGMPLAGEINIQRFDGTRGRLFGWVTRFTNEHGKDEFQSVCIDVTESHQLRKANETRRYIKALTDVYDRIFEYDLSNNTMKCLDSHNSAIFKWLENIPMQIDEANEKWISSIVAEEDRSKVRNFFEAFRSRTLYRPENAPPQITYHEISADGTLTPYNGTLIKINDAVSFYCCRSVANDDETRTLRSENISLKENMQELVRRFRDGIAAFELSDGNVTPLYASDNVCEFFGFTKDEWLPLMEKSTPVREFIARSETSYSDFAELLRTGEAEFTYYDFGAEKERRIKAICSPKSPEASPRYVLLYNMDEFPGTAAESADDGMTVSIRTFGYFDVFIGGKPIAFRSQKAKELFALLIDRRGGFVTSEEAIGFLWEEEPINSVTLARYRKVALRLKNILEEYGISDVMESVAGKRRIIPEKVRCDLYDYLSGKEEYAQLFKGSYLTNYSWGEITLGELSSGQ